MHPHVHPPMHPMHARTMQEFDALARSLKKGASTADIKAAREQARKLLEAVPAADKVRRA